MHPGVPEVPVTLGAPGAGARAGRRGRGPRDHVAAAAAAAVAAAVVATVGPHNTDVAVAAGILAKPLHRCRTFTQGRILALTTRSLGARRQIAAAWKRRLDGAVEQSCVAKATLRSAWLQRLVPKILTLPVTKPFPFVPQNAASSHPLRRPDTVA